MADNLTTTTTVSTIPSGTKIGTRSVTYSGDTSTNIGVSGLVIFSGADDAKTATDVDGGNGTAATALRVTVASDSTGQLIALGNVAHDGVDSGNPVKIGGRAVAHSANPTAVAAADRTDLLTNRAGIPFFVGGHPNIVTIELAFTAAQTDVAIVTIATGMKIVVTQLQVVCDNANTVNVAVRVGFGTANTPTTTGVVLTHPGISPGSGVSRGDGSGMLGVGADDADLRITATVPTTGSARVLVSYYTIES